MYRLTRTSSRTTVWSMDRPPESPEVLFGAWPSSYLVKAWVVVGVAKTAAALGFAASAGRWGWVAGLAALLGAEIAAIAAVVRHLRARS